MWWGFALRLAMSGRTGQRRFIGDLAIYLLNDAATNKQIERTVWWCRQRQEGDAARNAMEQS